MKNFTHLIVMSGLVAAAPLNALPDLRGVRTSISIPTAASAPISKILPGSTLLNLGADGSSGLPIDNIVAVTIPLVGKKSVSSISPTATPSVTKTPESTHTYATAFPSTFSAPVQGTGVLSLKNLPAMPPVIDKSLSGVLGAVYGLMSGVCNEQHMCSITIAGSIQSLLVDGDKYSTESTISAWCDSGRCYGSANPTVNATAPFEITCDKLTGNTACSATIAGLAQAIFMNGNQLELWGWLTPSGYCQGGICTASLSAFGDPMY